MRQHGHKAMLDAAVTETFECPVSTGGLPRIVVRANVTQ
jgi:hypothetical protein